jgi:5-methylcytosine-specific restriction protein B
MSDNPRSLFAKICEFSKNYPLIHGGLPVGDPRTDGVLGNLKSLGQHLANALKERGCTDFGTIVSEGHGAFPRYTWICFLPPRQRVAEGVYAGICFDGKGSGALAGCMRSVASKAITLKTIKRSHGAKKRINVGDFNDAFLNPEEYSVKTFSFDDLTEHLAKSLSMAEQIVSDASETSSVNRGRTSENAEVVEAFRAICDFSRAYNEAGEAWRKDSAQCLEVRRNLAKIEQWVISSFAGYRGQLLRAKSADGATNFPKVPWVCLLPEGQEVNDGVYVSICFDRQGRGAVSGFAESATNPKGLPVVKRTGPHLKIDVNGPSAGTRFNDGFVNPEEFFKDSFDAEKLRDHIAKSLDLCLDYLGGNQSPPMKPDDKNNFVAALQECGFVAEEGLPGAFLQSLIAKPFVILTGNSGTGKTKIAELLAAWLRGDDHGGHELVAVGADWTDNRNVVGFVNYLRQGDKEDGPIYQSTPVLDLLLRAAQTPSLPFFLILDEMNLSHVERYFADFLSAMEAREGLLRLHSEGDAEEGDSSLPRFDGDTRGVPSELVYPRNVFVIGTVNVDETTYMFSPKVLDRAHVIEFHADAKHVIDLLNDPKPLDGMSSAPEGTAARFLELSKSARGIDGQTLDSLPAKVAAKINRHLADVLDILRRARFEFAFRTAKELNAYLRVCRHLSIDQSRWDETGWKDDLDTEILQKVLPRLHGSRSRAGNLVGALVSYFANGNKDEALQFFPVEGQEEPVKTLTDAVVMAPASPEFPRCFKKMQTMARVLVEEQFVSFIC